MKIERLVEIEDTDIKIGDRVHVGHYTATCQEITRKSALFLLDQYLDESMEMNRRNTNLGGYAKSDLRKALRSEKILGIFKSIREYMMPFETGDLLRIPFVGEIYGQDYAMCFEPDDRKQWELMRDRKNRLTFRGTDWGYGWLQNRVKDSRTHYGAISTDGDICTWNATRVIEIRPVFQIAAEKRENFLSVAYKIEKDPFSSEAAGRYPDLIDIEMQDGNTVTYYRLRSADR